MRGSEIEICGLSSFCPLGTGERQENVAGNMDIQKSSSELIHEDDLPVVKER